MRAGPSTLLDAADSARRAACGCGDSSSRLYHVDRRISSVEPHVTASDHFAEDVRPREVLAWAMYDFANSGYTTVVITAVFNADFVAVVPGNAPAATFALASLPTFLLLKERARSAQVAAGENLARAAFARLAQPVRQATRYQDLARFLICVVFYQAGIQTVIALAAIYAEQALGFTTKDTITLILVVNVTAAVGAFAFGNIQDRLGHVRTIALTLVLWIATTLIAWSASESGLFWVAANLAGLCLGSSQSAGRALVGYLSPADRRAEFFGLWGLAVKLSSVLGPITYGSVTWMTGGNHRLAMLATGGFFVAGLLLLAGIDVPRGRRAAGQS